MKKSTKIPKLRAVPKEFWENKDWYVKRFNWYPFLLFHQVINIFYHPFIKTPFKYKWAGTFCNESAEWYWDARDQVRVRRGILARAYKTKEYSKWFLAEFSKHFKNLEKVFTNAEKLDFGRLSDSELLSVLDRLFWAEAPVAAWGYLADSFLSGGESNWLLEEIKKEIINQKVIEILTAPGFESFVNQERIHLFKVGVLKKKNKILYSQLLQEHRDRYYWIQNNYWVVYNHSVDFFEQELLKLQRQKIDLVRILRQESQRVKINLQRKNDIFTKLHLSKRLQNIIYCSDCIGLIQDTRKQAALRLNHFLFLIAEQIAKRVKIPRQEALNLVYPEVRDILINRKPDRQELKRRIKKCFIFLSDKGYKILSGAKAEVISTKNFHYADNKMKGLTGTPAFRGKVTGLVRIVNSHKDMALFKKGEILVTNNTTPEFVPLMKKSVAIATEQGGMTTHAAIVSRELRVPCIVGVKGITRILKTRDLVEVDAERGIVKLLKKAR